MKEKKGKDGRKAVVGEKLRQPRTMGVEWFTEKG